MERTRCAVMTQSRVHLIVPLTWVEDKENKMTRIFYSPNQQDEADFELPTKYFVNKDKKGVYNAYIIRFLENEEIEQFSKRKRRRLNAVYYNEDNEEKPAGKLEWNFVQEDIDLTLDSPKKSLVAAKTLVERSNSNVESTVARQSLNFVTTAHPNVPEHSSKEQPSIEHKRCSTNTMDNLSSTRVMDVSTNHSSSNNFLATGTCFLVPSSRDSSEYQNDIRMTISEDSKRIQPSDALANDPPAATLHRTGTPSSLSQLLRTQKPRQCYITSKNRFEDVKRVTKTPTGTSSSNDFFAKEKNILSTSVRHSKAAPSISPSLFYGSARTPEFVERLTRIQPLQTLKSDQLSATLNQEGSVQTVSTRSNPFPIQSVYLKTLLNSIVNDTTEKTSSLSSQPPTTPPKQSNAKFSLLPSSFYGSVSTSKLTDRLKTIQAPKILINNPSDALLHQKGFMQPIAERSIQNIKSTGSKKLLNAVSPAHNKEATIKSPEEEKCHFTNTTSIMKTPKTEVNVSNESSGQPKTVFTFSPSLFYGSARTPEVVERLTRIQPLQPLKRNQKCATLDQPGSVQTVTTRSNIFPVQSAYFSNLLNSIVNDTTKTTPGLSSQPPTTKQSETKFSLLPSSFYGSAPASELLTNGPSAAPQYRNARQQRISFEETFIKQEKDLELARKTIKNLQTHLGTVIVSGDSESDDDRKYPDEDIEVEVEQKDAFFASAYAFKTNEHGDRYYLNGHIKISKDIVQTLKNMNASIITNQPDYDYRFTSYLLNQVYTNEILVNSAVYQSQQNKNRKFRALSGEKFEFIQDVFKERVKNDKKRMDELSKLINKKCNGLRQNLKNRT